MTAPCEHPHGFSCQGCNGLFCWDCREKRPDDVECRTIANRFCNDDACIAKEAEVHGLPISRVRAWHRNGSIG